METVFAGTTVKLKLTAQDQSETAVEMENCDFDVYAWTYSKNTNICTKPASAIHITKDECVKKDAYTYLAEVSTTGMTNGYLVVRLDIKVPDSDLSSGVREEVLQMVPNIQIIA